VSEFLNNIHKTTQTAAGKLRVRSALNPMLWLCAIILPICLIFAYIFRDLPEVRNLLIYIGISPIGITCLGFIGFAIFRPDKLQSEEYQLRHESLQIIQQKSGRISLSPSSIEAIANPNTKKLKDEEEKIDS
jgi:hypothetical protein